MKFKIFYFLMQLIFIIGKILSLVAWSWWIVLIPLRVPAVLLIIFIVLGIFIESLIKQLENSLSRARCIECDIYFI